MKSAAFSLSVFVLLFFNACNDKPDDPIPVPDFAKLNIEFIHLFDGLWLEFDTPKYFNAAGNKMMFSELQYFISDVTLHYADGTTYRINKWKDIHYVDSDIPSTQIWNVYDSIPPGTIDSVSFIFGIDEEKNKSFLYVNPPESLMFWPDILGGGYHYMKLNGKWFDPQQVLQPFNFHLGIGQEYDNEGNITGFIQNYFTVVLKNMTFTMVKGKTQSLGFVMDVENWFETPNTWDFNDWGGDIMQNQAAMHAACENGRDVFYLDIPIGIEK